MRNKGQKNRILIVSADHEFKEMIGDVLRSYGLEVLQAESGQMALRTMRDNLVDAIVLDHETPFARHTSPEQNGSTLEAITDQNPFLPIVLTCAARADLDHSTFLMADAVLEEPVRYSELLDAVETVLNETLRERAQRKGADLKVMT